MIVRVCAVLLLALFVVPFGMGEAFISARDKRLSLIHISEPTRH